MIRRLSFGVAVMLAVSTTAHAQVYSIAEPKVRVIYGYAAPNVVGAPNPLAELTRLHKAGDRTAFEKAALALLDAAVRADNDLPEASRKGLASHLGDLGKDYYNVIWQSTGADGKPVVNRVLVRSQASPQHASRILGVRREHRERSPGERRVLDVLLSSDQSAELHSVWVFTPLENPVVAQIPAVVDKINPLKIIATSLGTANVKNALLIEVREPSMLLGRAKIQIRDAITTYRDADLLSLAVDEAAASILLREARLSACARLTVEKTKALVDKAAAGESCRGEKADPGGCAKAIENAVKDGVGKAVKQAAADAQATTPPSVSVCETERTALGADPVVATEQAFLEAVKGGGAKTVNGESVLTNTPLARYSFGVMTGLMIGGPSTDDPRVKVDGGKIVRAPIERALTMVIFNVHPRAYDSEWPGMTAGERFRLFGGAVLTPDFGLTAGAGVGIVRGLSLNAGVVLLLSNTPGDGETIGAEPKNSNDPFKTGRAVAGFLGFSYAFK